jgi:hypothetical protein
MFAYQLLPKMHCQCTEGFYRKEVEDQIQTEPNKTAEDRRKMMEMLKRLQEETSFDECSDMGSDELDEGEEEESSLSKRLANLDIGQFFSTLRQTLSNGLPARLFELKTALDMTSCGKFSVKRRELHLLES